MKSSKTKPSRNFAPDESKLARPDRTIELMTSLSSPIRSIFRPQIPLIPPEIIRAWTNSEYRIGDRHSTDYEYIGAALAVRGYYRYGTFREDGGRKNLLHAGYCFIDFEGPDLFIAGIRIYTGPHQNPPHNEQEEWVHPIYWRSRYSKFVSNGRLLKIHFGYCAFKFLNTKKKGYEADGLAYESEMRIPESAVQQFGSLEDVWRVRRAKLQHDCHEADVNGDMEELDRALESHGSDIMTYLEEKNSFMKDLALLQHHAIEDELVGIITVDITQTIARDSEFVAVLYQPIDLPAGG